MCMKTERRPGRGVLRSGARNALAVRSTASILSADGGEPRSRRQRHLLRDSDGTRPIGPVTRRLLDVKAMLEAGDLSPFCLFELRDALEQLAQSVWGESADSSTISDDGEAPFSVCIVGGLWLEVLLHGPSFGGAAAVARRTFECSRFKDPAQAQAELGPNVPDLCIIDMDTPGSSDLIAALANDPRLDLVPVITVTLANGPHDGAPPPLGVTRAFTHPIDAVAFREACAEVVVQRREPTIRMEFPPLFAALPPATTPVHALPAAPAAKSERPTAPAPHVPGASRAERISPAAATRAKPSRRSAAPQPLEGRHVIVANDDPAVCWFLADQLRRLGATVREALGSASALDQALDMGFATRLDAIFCEAEMRGMDGVMLTRVLRSEARTRHVPVIILAATKQALRVARSAGVADACLSMGTAPEVLAATAAGYIRVRSFSDSEPVMEAAPVAQETARVIVPSRQPSIMARVPTPPPPPDLAIVPIASTPLFAVPELGLPPRQSLAVTPSFPEIPQPGVRREIPQPAVRPEERSFDCSVTTPPPPPTTPRANTWKAVGLLLGAILLGGALRWRTGQGHVPAPRPIAARTVAISGEGLLDVSLTENVTLTVDGVPRGRGPKLNVTLPAGLHELATDAQGDKPRSVEIIRGRVTRVDLAHSAQAIPLP
jgi:CheY-like chemotaxis protein